MSHPTPQNSAQLAVATLPSIDAERYASVGRYAGAVALACFEAMGGMSRMVEWAQDNPTDYYTKIFAKIIQKTQAVEHSGSVGIDNAVDRLQMIEAQAAVGADFDGEVLEREFDL